MNKVVFVSAKRTPIGKMGGSLAKLSAIQLGSIAIRAAMEEINLSPTDIQEVMMGNVLSAGLGQNPARQAALQAGISQETPATTINDVCGSGMQAIRFGAQQIQLGELDVVVAGGMESMSNAPYLIPKARFGLHFGNTELIDSLENDGIKDAYGNYPMGITAENLLDKYPASRQDLDEFSLQSHQKALKAQAQNLFAKEMVPITVGDKHGQKLVEADESVRHSSMQQLGRLKPAFKKTGKVTAGNSSPLNDGAAAVIMTSEEYAKQHHLPILGYFTDWSVVGVDPAIMGIGPYYAIKKLLKKTKLSIDRIERFELNEAFAAQALIVQRKLQINPELVNVNGGAIALGHPLGASGARIIVTLLHEMNRSNKSKGIAGLCIGGGMGAATLITR